MKNTKNTIKIAVMAAVVVLTSVSLAFAAGFDTTSHVATVSVPGTLSISADTTNFTLSFSDNVSGSESDTTTVVYTLKANDMTQADGATAINANLDFLYDRMDFQADVGTYTKVNGNTEVTEAAAGFTTIGTSNTAIANKANSTGDGKILDGTLPVTYKAVATDDLPSGDQLHTLYVTLTEI